MEKVGADEFDFRPGRPRREYRLLAARGALQRDPNTPAAILFYFGMRAACFSDMAEWLIGEANDISLIRPYFYEKSMLLDAAAVYHGLERNDYSPTCAGGDGSKCAPARSSMKRRWFV